MLNNNVPSESFEQLRLVPSHVQQAKPAVSRDPQFSGWLPASNPMPTFWQTDLHPLQDHRSTEQLPEHVDFVIIGAGYAGVASAYHMTKDGSCKDLSILILEARGVCSGATGRNGGHLRPDLYGHIPTYIDRAGAEAGLEIAEFEIAHVHAIKKIVEKEGIDCDFTLTRTIDTWCNEDSAKQAKQVYDQMVARNFKYMDDVIFYTGKAAEGVRLERMESLLELTRLDLRSKRRQGCCIVYCWHHVAIQIYLGPC